MRIYYIHAGIKTRLGQKQAVELHFELFVATCIRWTETASTSEITFYLQVQTLSCFCNVFDCGSVKCKMGYRQKI